MLPKGTKVRITSISHTEVKTLTNDANYVTVNIEDRPIRTVKCYDIDGELVPVQFVEILESRDVS